MYIKIILGVSKGVAKGIPIHIARGFSEEIMRAFQKLANSNPKINSWNLFYICLRNFHECFRKYSRRIFKEIRDEYAEEVSERTPKRTF